MNPVRVCLLFQAYRELYGEEPQGLDLYGVAVKVIEMAKFLDTDLARRSLHAISRMHDYEEIELDIDEKRDLEELLGELN